MDHQSSARINAIDLARGIAVSLMILSHGIIGLIPFYQLPSWGQTPIHLITKFSSTIFFLVFGMALAVSYAPATLDQETWPMKRKKLLIRGLVILFWYKVLTIVEMSHLHDREQILDALLYQNFPSYSEILGFYALALLWIPFVLPLWQRSSLLIKALFPIVFTAIAFFLTPFDFWQSPELKAIFVEEKGYYTWGQLTRAPLVFTGLFIGYFLKENYAHFRKRAYISGALFGTALLLFSVFLFIYNNSLAMTFYEIAENKGKHPPEMDFILFSLSGALFIIALTLLLGEKGAKWLAPITLIGKDTLTAFVFHITVLFVFYRYLFNLWLNVSYEVALGLTGLLIAMTAIWIKLNLWRKKYETPPVSDKRSGFSRGLGPHELNAN